MSRNKVQFQKSMSIHSFISQFGTEEQCRKHLFSLRWPNAGREHTLFINQPKNN